MLIVGLTGGIGTGKSTVSHYLQQKHGLQVIDADFIARQVVEPGRQAYNQIVDTFSAEVPDLVKQDDKRLNRPALGKAVFGKKDKLKKLNSIVHPAVRKAIIYQILKAYIQLQDMVVLDVPLLFESGLDKICGITLTISCPKSLQIERLRCRNPELSEQDSSRRIESQMSNDERNFKADLVINNNKNKQELERDIELVLREIRPSRIRTIVEYIPFFGILAAIITLVMRLSRDKFKGSKSYRKVD